MMIILNGRLVLRQDFQRTPLSNHDSLTLTPILAGG
jgi:hypothetical protein